MAIAPAVTAPANPRLRTTSPSERVVNTASAATARSPTTTTTRYSAGSAAASATAQPSANSAVGGRLTPSQRPARLVRDAGAITPATFSPAGSALIE